jgi:CubicO group peptidase (beta-lactamase class C family)
LGDLLDDAPPEWASIPFWRLLNHTSGITMIVNRSEFEQIDADPASTNADIYQVVRQFPLEYQPGEASRYRQSGYAVAEMIVAERLGKTWPELVEEHVTGSARAMATVHGPLASGRRTTPLLLAPVLQNRREHPVFDVDPARPPQAGSGVRQVRSAPSASG